MQRFLQHTLIKYIYSTRLCCAIKLVYAHLCLDIKLLIKIGLEMQETKACWTHMSDILNSSSNTCWSKPEINQQTHNISNIKMSLNSLSRCCLLLTGSVTSREKPISHFIPALKRQAGFGVRDDWARRKHNSLERLTNHNTRCYHTPDTWV